MASNTNVEDDDDVTLDDQMQSEIAGESFEVVSGLDVEENPEDTTDTGEPYTDEYSNLLDDYSPKQGKNSGAKSK